MSNIEYTDKRPHTMGLMDEVELYVNPKLTSTEKLVTIQQLENAKSLGYDSCVVTLSGTYATKKL